MAERWCAQATAILQEFEPIYMSEQDMSIDIVQDRSERGILPTQCIGLPL